MSWSLLKKLRQTLERRAQVSRGGILWVSFRRILERSSQGASHEEAFQKEVEQQRKKTGQYNFVAALPLQEFSESEWCQLYRGTKDEDPHAS